MIFLAPELEGNVGVLLVDCKLDWEWFASFGLSDVGGCQTSCAFWVGVFERNMPLKKLFFFFDESLESLDSCLVTGGIDGVRE